jgi:hypothetical protein
VRFPAAFCGGICRIPFGDPGFCGRGMFGGRLPEIFRFGSGCLPELL